MTCEINPNLPSALLRMSEVVVFEASSGVKANIQRFYNSIPASRMDKTPMERARLYGLLAWFNAVVQERLRYTPLGWAKRYEFSESDTLCSLDVIDHWVDAVAAGRQHVNPTELPWQALQVLLSQSLYGGRLDHPFDQAALDAFIQSVFNAKNNEANAVLVQDADGKAVVTLPNNVSRQSFDAWVKALPDSNSPLWIGLPLTAETQLKISVGQGCMKTLGILQQDILEDEDIASKDSSKTSHKAHLKTYQETIDYWLNQLPVNEVTSTVVLDKSSDAAALPLERYLAREWNKGRTAVETVKRDLLLVRSYCKGEAKLTNTIRDLILACFSKGSIPKTWKGLYSSSCGGNVPQWMSDFADRLKALLKYKEILLNKAKSAQSLLQNCSHWLGGSFAPEALITASRQQTAQANKWSLEDLELYLEVGESSAASVQDTIIEGLLLEGAAWSAGSKSIQISDDLQSALPHSKFKWTLKGANPAEFVTLPLYLDHARSHLVFEVKVALAANNTLPASVWAKRGVAILMQKYM